MIPVILLGIEHDHKILDLCASPGSKTIQAVDALYQQTNKPNGFIIANELDSKRSYILSHRCKLTLRDNMTNVAIVTHNACKFPNVTSPLSSTAKKKTTFDHVICDVPCSGDGTLRKDLKVWKTWHPSYGISLHTTQLRIAKRGISLLNIGGIMTYSTCSFHPIENEAVVTALLNTGCVEVIDEKYIQDKLNGIVYRNGIKTWKVLDDDCNEIAFGGKYPSSLWPPTKENPNYDYIIDSLSRCVR